MDNVVQKLPIHLIIRKTLILNFSAIICVRPLLQNFFSFFAHHEVVSELCVLL